MRAQALILGLGKLYQYCATIVVDPTNNCLDVVCRHCGAASGAATRSAPLMQEDAGPIAGNGVIHVVVDHHAPAILGDGAHFLRAVPIDAVNLLAVDDLGVITRG